MQVLMQRSLLLLIVATASQIVSSQQLATRGDFSVASGTSISIATAGASATFTITSKDESGNARTSGGDNFVVTLDGLEPQSVSVIDNLSGLYTVSYVSRKSGSAQLSIALVQGGGLWASYFENIWFFYMPVLERVDPQINFDWGSGGITHSATDYVSIRWAGRVRPRFSETYTFYADADDGVRLWVNNVQLIDRWDGGANMTAAKVSLTASRFHSIKLEYKHSTGQAQMSLFWSSPSTLKEVIPASQLFYEVPCKSFPSSLIVMPAVTCAALSVASGSGLQPSASAGVYSSFRIESRDSFSNLREIGGDIIVAHVYPSSASVRAVQSLLSDNLDGSYFAVFRPFTSGSSVLGVQYLNLGGLFATMYADTGFTQSVSSVAVTSVDYTKNSAPYISAADVDSLFSIRYAGFFKASVSGLHTFLVDLAYQSENYFLYLDNLLAIDASSGAVSAIRSATISLVATQYYSVQLNYISSSSTANQRKVRLSIVNPNSASFDPAPPDNLYTGFHVAGSPFAVVVATARLCASLCVVTDSTGDSLSIATAGQSAVFSITSKDVYGNFLSSSTGTSESFQISLSGTSGAVGYTSSNPDGTYHVMYSVTQSGTYDLSVVFGSAPVGNSPFKIWAQPARRFLKNSPVRGSGLTLLTAGIQATVTITIRDIFSNWQPHASVSNKIKISLADATNIAVSYCSSNGCPSFANGGFAATPLSLDNPRYVASFSVTKAGNYSLAIYGTDAFDTHVMGSPFPLTVEPGVFHDAVVSDFQSTSSIAGFPSYFSAQTFDSFGNVCYNCTQVLSVFTRLSNVRDIVGTSASVAPSKYIASYTATRSQGNFVHVMFGTIFGVMATYYTGVSQGSPLPGPVHVPDIDFSVAAGNSYQGISSTFSARYAALFRATLSGTATFKIAHKSVSDSYRLTLSNSVVATLSVNSEAALNPYTVSGIERDQLYEIVFLYIASSTSHSHGIVFSVNMGFGDTPVGSKNLFFPRNASVSPLAFSVTPGIVCAGLLTRQSTGHSLSIVTAGGIASFTIQSVDLFGNIRTAGVDDGIEYVLIHGGYVPPKVSTSSFLNIQASATDGGTHICFGTVEATAGGGYKVKYSASLAGFYQLSGRVMRPGGVYGLYFETDNLQDHSLTPSMSTASQPTFQRLDSQINFRWGFDKPVNPLDTYFSTSFSLKSVGPDFFSVRWYGSILAPHSEVFTFSAEADDGVRFYVDNLLIINEWEFKSGVVDGTIALIAGSMYSIKLEYRELINNATIVLMWSSRSLPRTIIPSSSLYYTITSGSISSQIVYVPPAVACHTLSSIYGPGLTVATVGLPAYFTIQSLDCYGNHRLLMDSPYFYFRLASITSNSLLRPYKSQFNGLTSSSVLTSHFQRIANPLFSGGLTATYYAGSFTNGLRVSCQSLAWLPANGCGGVDLASFASSSNPFNLVGLGTMPGTAFLARWAGFFRPTSSGQYRFFIGKSAATTAGFSISESKGGSSPIASFSGNTASNPSATANLVANRFYEVSVQFDQSGQSTDFNCKLQYAYEASSSSTTAFGSTSLVPTSNLFPLAGRYRVMYTAPTVKGDYSPQVSIAVPGGLDATFYDDMSFSSPKSTVFHTHVDFTSVAFASDSLRASLTGLPNAGYGAGINVSDFNSFSVRWQGFFMATDAETTFSVSIRESDERLRLWVDGLLLINNWDFALSPTSFSATFGALVTDSSGLRQSDLNSLFDVKLEYVQFGGQSGITVPLFTGTNVYGSRDISVPPPFPLHPAATCAALSRVRGSALTRATAGHPASFTIMSFDMYNNDRDIDGDVYVARLFPVVCEFASQCLHIYGTVTSMGDGTYLASYMGTKKGSYDIVTSLALPAALSATYYAGDGQTSFTGARTNVFKTYDVVVTMPSSQGGVRYSGFVRPPTAGPFTFSVATSASTAISIWIFDTRFGVSARNTYSSTSGSSIISFPTANALYDVRVDLSSSNTDLSLLWGYSGLAAVTIPTNRVFARTDVSFSDNAVPSGPYSKASLMLVASNTCATQSLSKGSGLTIATAGTPAAFTLTSRDEYGNDIGLTTDAWVIKFSGASVSTFAAAGDSRALSSAYSSLDAASYANVVGPGRYSVSYVLTTSGLYSIDVLRAVPGGLKAEYFCNSWLSGTPCHSAVDFTVDFNWGLGDISPSNSIHSIGSNFASIRWSGYFLWETSDIVTFYTETDEGVRLYIDGIAIIDEWDAIGSNFSATWAGSAVSALYSVVMEYRESTDVAYCRLLYSSALSMHQPIPNSLLFSSADHVFGSPFSSYVQGVSTCASTSTASLSTPFSLFTVGTYTAISVTTRDQYGNVRTVWDAASPSVFVRSCAVDFSDYCKHAVTRKSTAGGSWTASFTATRASASNVLVTLVHTANAAFQGMHATYYKTLVIGSGVIKSNAVSINSIDLSSDTKTAAWDSNPNPSPFSIRWMGIFVASTVGQYTFSVTVSASDGAILYVNNVKVVDGWATSSSSQSLVGTISLSVGINSFYDVILDYRRDSTSGGSVTGFGFTCCNANSPSAFTAAMMQPLVIPPMPFQVQYLAEQSDIQKSVLNGISLTIATAGNLAQFSVTSRDLFGNQKSFGGDPMYVYVSKADGTVATSNISDSGNGVYICSYLPRFEGSYVVSIAIQSSAKAYSMTVFPTYVCASKCITTSSHLTVATAGYACSFTVTMRDAFLNYRTSFTDDLIVKMSGPSGEMKNLPVSYSSNKFALPYIPTYQASYRTSRSGIFSIDVRVATSNGLNASFFADPDLSQLAFSRIDSTVNFDWGSGAPDTGFNAVDMFSVQWSGFVKPDYNSEYTFSVSIADVGDRVRLWLDDYYIINFWNVAPVGVINAATIKLSSNTLYDIKLQYRDTTGSAAVTLTWSRNGENAVVIPSSRLVSSTAAVAGSPFAATVFPALTCGSLSTASGHGLSLATAGVPASFTITAYDHLGNRITHSSDVFTVRARNPSSAVSDRVGTITPMTNGLYSGVYTPILKRNEVTQWHDVPISMGVRGGPLLATYYRYSDGSLISTASADLAASVTPLGVAVNYNARYSGFIQPPSTRWTFAVLTSVNGLSVKVDGKELLTGAGSAVIVGSTANALYDIDITVTNVGSGSAAIAIELAGTQQTLIQASSRVFQRHDLTFNTVHSSGLATTFFSGASFDSPTSQATMSNIDWSYAANSPKSHSSAPSSGAYGVRWTGFFRPTMRDVYTFYVQKSSGETSVSLTLDNGPSVSIGNSATEGSATVFIAAAHQFYEISLELLSTNSASAFYRLLWVNAGNTYSNYDRPATNSSISVKTVINQESLFKIRTSSRVSRDDQHEYYDGNTGWPYCGSSSTGDVLRWYQCRGLGLRFNRVPKVEVRSASSCASNSLITGVFVSLSTVGVQHSFDIVTKDSYSNILDGMNAAVTLVASLQSGGSFGKFYGSALPTSAATSPSDPSGRYTVTYVVSTVAGSYFLNVGLADSSGSGLRGVYFSEKSFSGNVAQNRIDASLNFSWGASAPVSKLSSLLGWSARWTGFVRLADSVSGLFTFYLRTGLGGGRLYVANSLVVDSTSVASAGEYFGVATLENNVIYDIVVEYIASESPAFVQVSYASASNPKQIIPSSNLFPFSSNLQNGARILEIKHGTVCGALSQKSFEKLSIATAGIAASFKITSADHYGNFRTDQSNVADCGSAGSCVFFATVIPANPSLSPPRRSTQGLITPQNVNNFFDVRYTVTAAGLYSTVVFASPTSGGLFATYYDDLMFSAPKVSQLEANPGWTRLSTEVPELPGSPLLSDGLFSVKLAGAFKPTRDGVHTFSVTHSEKLTLFVDSVLLINQATFSGSATSRSATILIPVVNAFYDITLLYASDQLSGSQLSDLSINGVAYSSFSANLYASSQVGAASGIVVYPSPPCGSWSTIRGVGLSIATAGTPVFLTITVRDNYYNLRTHAGDNVVVRAFALPGSSVTPAHNFFDGASVNSGSSCAGCPTAPVPATITDFTNALCTVSLLLTVSGRYKVAASLARKGGLVATFYAVDNSFAYSTAVSGSASFSSLTFSSVSAVSGRWHGFIQPSLAGTYTFSVVPVAASNEFIKLWISQRLVIDRSASSIPQSGFSATFSFATANSLYDIFVVYSTSGGGFNIFWERMGSSTAAADVFRQSIPTDRLYNREDVVGDSWYSVSPAHIRPALGCGSNSFVTGIAATLTAGSASSFTILSRDAYSNARTIGSDFTFNAVSVHSNGELSVYGTVSYAGIGGDIYNGAITALTVSGLYYLHVRGGGVHVQGSPFTVSLLPAQECSSTSLSFGAGLTVTTVNVASSFYVQVRDAWSNVRSVPNVESSSIFVGRAFTSSIGAFPETTNAQPYAASTSTSAKEASWRLPSWYVGSYQLNAAPAQGHFGYFRGVSLAVLGGFLATYYHNLASVNALVSSGAPLKTTVDRFSNSNTVVGVTAVFAARWSGFIRSTTSGLVTWNVFTQSSSAKGKVWVNGGAAAYGSPAGDGDVSAVFTTVANTLYHVQVEYRSSSAAPNALQSFGSSIVTDNMYADFALKGTPTQLAVY